jgi:hypothetical protein
LTPKEEMTEEGIFCFNVPRKEKLRPAGSAAMNSPTKKFILLKK